MGRKAKKRKLTDQQWDLVQKYLYIVKITLTKSGFYPYQGTRYDDMYSDCVQSLIHTIHWYKPEKLEEKYLKNRIITHMKQAISVTFRPRLSDNTYNSADFSQVFDHGESARQGDVAEVAILERGPEHWIQDTETAKIMRKLAPKGSILHDYYLARPKKTLKAIGHDRGLVERGRPYSGERARQMIVKELQRVRTILTGEPL